MKATRRTPNVRSLTSPRRRGDSGRFLLLGLKREDDRQSPNAVDKMARELGKRLELTAGLCAGRPAGQRHDRRERDQGHQQNAGRDRAGQGDGGGNQQRSDPSVEGGGLELAEIAIDRFDLVDDRAARLADRGGVATPAVQHHAQGFAPQLGLDPQSMARRQAGGAPCGQGPEGQAPGQPQQRRQEGPARQNRCQGPGEGGGGGGVDHHQGGQARPRRMSRAPEDLEEAPIGKRVGGHPYENAYLRILEYDDIAARSARVSSAGKRGR